MLNKNFNKPSEKTKSKVCNYKTNALCSSYELSMGTEINRFELQVLYKIINNIEKENFTQNDYDYLRDNQIKLFLRKCLSKLRSYISM